MVTQEISFGSFVSSCLRANGVSTVFGIPGTHNIEFYRGFQREGIRHVVTRHEQGAAFAADGYSRISGIPGIVVVTSGPGLTNSLTGLANAYADSIPVLALSTGMPQGQERRDAGFMHETKDQRSGMDAFLSASHRAETPNDARDIINDIFLSWKIGRPRPHHVEIPMDVMHETIEARRVEAHRVPRCVPASDSIEEAIRLLESAQRPLIIAGGGAKGASRQITALAERLQLPVATTVQGKGVVDEIHDLSAGAVVGTSSHLPLNSGPDVVIAVGTELRNSSQLLHEAKIVRIDIDRHQLNKHFSATVPLLGDADSIVQAILDGTSVVKPGSQVDGPKRQWIAEVQEAATRRREEAVRVWGALHDAILSACTAEPVIVGDSSQVSYRGTAFLRTSTKPGQFLFPDGYATLGFSLPAAIGAKIAEPNLEVISIVGDGAAMFSIQELITASANKLPIPIIVIDNGGYKEIKENMVEAGITPLGVDLRTPDWEGLAQSLECDSAQPPDLAQLKRSVSDALKGDRPTMIVVKDTLYNLL